MIYDNEMKIKKKKTYRYYQFNRAAKKPCYVLCDNTFFWDKFFSLSPIQDGFIVVVKHTEKLIAQFLPIR